MTIGLHFLSAYLLAGALSNAQFPRTIATLQLHGFTAPEIVRMLRQNEGTG